MTQLNMYIVGIEAETRAEADEILREKIGAEPRKPIFYASGGGDFTLIYTAPGSGEIETNGGEP